ncbi:NADPH-dependent oxidoreductase [Nocardia stercoris]|uniref:NADPH-dependent oxidoreductase n=1 Tax=Nocardia stercoris TaxID=2483361 RepID=A0A3M2L6C4_9NOCA|nr:NADPH-dependent oxidoreductase [Nocardia stercoris]
MIVGSVRDGRVGPTVARWFADEARTHGGFHVDVIDLLDYPLPLVIPAPGQFADPETTRIHEALAARIAAADAYVIVTPEYNHTLPAALKNTVDWVYAEWAAKPVGFVSYGGMSGGLRAVEHLRHIVAELHGVTVRESLSFHQVWEAFDGDLPRDREGSAAAAKGMLDRLVWWGRTLRAARLDRPYER